MTFGRDFGIKYNLAIKSLLVRTDEDNILIDEILAEEIESKSPESFKRKTLEELHNILDEAVANEDYETAARIRDEISKR